MTTRLIDLHPHVISNDDGRYPPNPLGGVQSDWSATRPVTFEQMVVEMDEAGVDKAAIVHASTYYGYDNSYLADCIARMPDRFTGVYAINVLEPDAVEKIEYWRERGMTGLRLFTGGSTMQTEGRWLVDPRTYPAWTHAADIGMSVCIQTTQEGLPMVVELLERFPGVNIVLDHMARPTVSDGPPYEAAEAIFSLSKFKNLYLKVTSRTFDLAVGGKATPETLFGKLVSEFGANRLAYGSNYPASEGPLKKLVDQAKAGLSSLSEEDRSWITARTAQHLYPALAD